MMMKIPNRSGSAPACLFACGFLVFSGVGNAQDSLATDSARVYSVHSRPLATLFQGNNLPADRPAYPITPATARIDLDYYAAQLATHTPNRSGDEHIADSLRRLRSDSATVWLQRLAGAGWGDSTTQADLFGSLAARAGDDQLAQQIFDRQLAITGRTTVQQSATLENAIAAFTDDRPDTTMGRRLVIAETYFQQLLAVANALDFHGKTPANDIAGGEVLSAGPPTPIRTARAGNQMVTAHYGAGETGKVVESAMSIVTWLEGLPWTIRSKLWSGIDYPIVHWALAGQEGGREKIAMLHDRLEHIITTVGSDTIGYRGDVAYDLRSSLGELKRLKTTELPLLGKQPSAILAHAWLNTSDSTYHDQPVEKRLFGDGNIWVIGYTRVTCPHCPAEMPKYNRLQARFPQGVKVLVLTRTDGAWGGDVTTPDQEVEKITEYYQKTIPVHVPMGIWAGAREDKEEGWDLKSRSGPEEDPNAPEIFGTRATPMLTVIDGSGRIRRVVKGGGGGDRSKETGLVRFINSLLLESKQSLATK